MNTIAVAVAIIFGGSVSSGFSGKPAPELVAEYLGVPYQNNASICHRVDASEAASVTPRAITFNIDGNYWRSYDEDCNRAAKAASEFLDATEGHARVIATVPDRNAGWFYRTVCGAQRAEQVCRPAINAVIREGCKENCVLLDADELYDRHKNEPDIHLTPEIWKGVAKEIMEKLK